MEEGREAGSLSYAQIDIFISSRKRDMLASTVQLPTCSEEEYILVDTATTAAPHHTHLVQHHLGHSARTCTVQVIVTNWPLVSCCLADTKPCVGCGMSVHSLHSALVSHTHTHKVYCN